ncbi:MAG TPA: beta-ketoacyl synthase N-terminal-like domain-containing protein [Candidatus Binatia bacterium]|nr:beta-ketoacyl synthase N-terminal-like domain-containing protein [Candidatus Binatia bacterium]
MTDGVALTGAAWTHAADDAALAPLAEPLRTRALRAERVTRLVLVAGSRALELAGLAVDAGPPRVDVGVVLGTMLGCFLTNAAYAERLAEAGPPGASPRLFAATVSNAAAGELAIACRLGGPTATLSAGRASGLVALGHAVDLVRDGRATTIVAGGADATGEAATRWTRDAALGLAPGDAAALAVLEPLAVARARGAAILGTLLGWGAAFEPRAGASGGDAALDAALRDAGLRRADVARIVGATTAEGRPDPLAACGPLALVATLAETPPGTAIAVVATCPTGHAAAVVARAGDVA